MESEPHARHHRDHLLGTETPKGIECWPDGAEPGQPPSVPAGHRACLWCHRAFVIVLRPGRPRLYCKRSCRQRAYERRAGLGVLPPVERRVTRPGPAVTETRSRPIAYEAGLSPAGLRRHAMRPAGRPDSTGRWSSLCGLQCRPTGRGLAGVDPRACRTCLGIQQHRPASEPFAPSPRLAQLRAVLEDAGVWLDRRQRWMRGTGRGLADAELPGTFGDVLSAAELVRLLVAAAA